MGMNSSTVVDVRERFTGMPYLIRTMPAEAPLPLPTSQGTGLAEALVDLSHHVLHLFAEAGREHHLSQQQVELICAVIVRGSVGMGELGSVLRVEKSNLSNLVDRLEQRGFVARDRAPDDRRATRVTLTERGEAAAHGIYDSVTRRLRALLDAIPQTDQRRLTDTARGIIEADRP